MNAKPFLLSQHERDFAKFRDLRPDEIKAIAGGGTCPTAIIPTGTVTPDCDGGDDGSD